MLVLTTVKIQKYLFSMNNYFIKASQSYEKGYELSLKKVCFVNFDPEF